MRIFLNSSISLVISKLLKSLHYAVTNLIEKEILVNFLGDTLHRLIFHQLCKNSANLIPERGFIQIKVFARNNKEATLARKVFHKSNCTPQFYAIKSDQTNKQTNKQSSLHMKRENMLQRFGCISFFIKTSLFNILSL